MKEAYWLRILAIGYLENTWLPWKERFAAALTNAHMYYGTVVTSRVESAHSALKHYMMACLTLLSNRRTNGIISVYWGSLSDI